MPLSGLIVLFQSPDHFDEITKIIDEPPHPPGSDGSGAARVDFDPPKETGQGRALQQEIKRIDTALRTYDGTVLAGYGEFNAAMKKARKLESLPEARVTEGVSIDDLLDVAGHRCYRSRGNRIKERENREFWIRANDHPSRDVYQSISLYFFILFIAGYLRVRQNLDPPEPNGPRAVFSLAQALQDRIS